MQYCPNCGGQVPEGASNCPNCGSPVVAQAPVTPQAPVQPSAPQSRPTVTNRSIVVAILLSVITCGIYGIIWFISLVNDVNTVCNDEKSNQSGGIVFLLTLITCGIYGLIWFYQAGKRMNVAGSKYGFQIADNSILYLVLGLLGFSIVDYCLVQSDLNKFSA